MLFDIDSTLYRNEEFVLHQYRVLIGAFAQAEGLDYESGRERIEAYRDAWALKNGARRPSLGNTCRDLGYPIPTSVEWRRQLIEPEAYLFPDLRLKGCLSLLSARFRLAALTNNPTDIGARTLSALGIGHFFNLIIGLETTMHSKPDPEPFDWALKDLLLSYPEVVMIGDRFEVDLEYPISRGAGGILVESMHDIYELPRILINSA